MKRHFIISITTVILIACLSCSSSTRITGSWKSPDLNTSAPSPKQTRSVLIASLSRNMEVRTKLENALAQQATQHNLKPIKSTEIFSPEFYQNIPAKQELLGKIRQTGADVILTVTLINKESETRYVPGSQMYSPYSRFGWYGGFYSYYNYWQPIVYNSGYYETDKTYFLETNLYDVKTEKLLWSAQSETVNPGSIDNFVKDYPKVLVTQMVKDGLLNNNSTAGL